jgi:hypothetical protein
MEARFHQYINFVGHMETMPADAKRLLQQIGAWEPYGSSGWGPLGNLSIFETSSGSSSVHKHATHSKHKVWQWFTPEITPVHSSTLPSRI